MLTHCLDDEHVSVYDNCIEQRARRAGLSLVQSVKLNGHDPHTYLKDMLMRLPMHSRINELLPAQLATRHRLNSRTPTTTGVKVYSPESYYGCVLCDPSHPWQRVTNENANGLLRQHLSKGTGLAMYTQHQLGEIAAKLNTRLRKTLGFKIPDQVIGEVLH